METLVVVSARAEAIAFAPHDMEPAPAVPGLELEPQRLAGAAVQSQPAGLEIGTDGVRWHWADARSVTLHFPGFPAVTVPSSAPAFVPWAGRQSSLVVDVEVPGGTAGSPRRFLRRYFIGNEIAEQSVSVERSVQGHTIVRVPTTTPTEHWRVYYYRMGSQPAQFIRLGTVGEPLSAGITRIALPRSTGAFVIAAPGPLGLRLLSCRTVDSNGDPRAASPQERAQLTSSIESSQADGPGLLAEWPEVAAARIRSLIGILRSSDRFTAGDRELAELFFEHPMGFFRAALLESQRIRAPGLRTIREAITKLEQGTWEALLGPIGFPALTSSLFRSPRLHSGPSRLWLLRQASEAKHAPATGATVEMLERWLARTQSPPVLNANELQRLWRRLPEWSLLITEQQSLHPDTPEHKRAAELAGKAMARADEPDEPWKSEVEALLAALRRTRDEYKNRPPGSRLEGDAPLDAGPREQWIEAHRARDLFRASLRELLDVLETGKVPEAAATVPVHGDDTEALARRLLAVEGPPVPLQAPPAGAGAALRALVERVQRQADADPRLGSQATEVLERAVSGCEGLWQQAWQDIRNAAGPPPGPGEVRHARVEPMVARAYQDVKSRRDALAVRRRYRAVLESLEEPDVPRDGRSDRVPEFWRQWRTLKKAHVALEAAQAEHVADVCATLAASRFRALAQKYRATDGLVGARREFLALWNRLCRLAGPDFVSAEAVTPADLEAFEEQVRAPEVEADLLRMGTT